MCLKAIAFPCLLSEVEAQDLTAVLLILTRGSPHFIRVEENTKKIRGQRKGCDCSGMFVPTKRVGLT